ncbi:MAG: hypothetical protein J4224_03130 [Candidatus Diapherotrites archaeon]|uniref:Uncharacterized protein n=1 Tax=Candidatus Iainarchaeum sp. TaxID=3101447 RepID=A0A7J4IZ32_9ARCH|nr:hypothetical protein [Candidatus Diapherotrites archaeon]HIH08226.1 hypothetical protein [Candidatus Diapherotrites archaeon]
MKPTGEYAIEAMKETDWKPNSRALPKRIAIEIKTAWRKLLKNTIFITAQR